MPITGSRRRRTYPPPIEIILFAVAVKKENESLLIALEIDVPVFHSLNQRSGLADVRDQALQAVQASNLIFHMLQD
jgi:hypothetical protein